MNNLATAMPLSTTHSTQFRPATVSDLSVLASRLRSDCANECLAIIGTDALTALLADQDNVYVIDGKDCQPCAAITVGKAGDSDCAILLTLATHINSRFLVNQVTKFCAGLHAQYDALHALLDARNTSTASLLVNCGFTFEKRFDQFGAEERPFNLYTSRR